MTVRAGASLVVRNSTISGTLVSTGAQAVQIFGSTVNGVVMVTTTSQDVTVAGNRFNGAVVLSGNTQVSANERYTRLAGAVRAAAGRQPDQRRTDLLGHSAPAGVGRAVVGGDRARRDRSGRAVLRAVSAMRAAAPRPHRSAAAGISHGIPRSGLLGEIVRMSVDTLRTSKMRSALTVLGVVIGITSIVGMTSLIRGFDESLRDR